MSNKLKVLYLDIDGVLSTSWTEFAQEDKCKLVKSLCEKYGLKIVITSTYRLSMDLELFHFKMPALEEFIVDVTPDSKRSKGLDIKRHMVANQLSRDEVLAIDDNDLGISEMLGPAFIKVDDRKGLQKSDIENIELYIQGLQAA